MAAVSGAVRIYLRDLYRIRYRRHYTLLLDFQEGRIPSYQIRWALAAFFRHQREYRPAEEHTMLHLLAWLYPLFRRLHRRAVPDFVNHTAMGIDAVFR